MKKDARKTQAGRAGKTRAGKIGASGPRSAWARLFRRREPRLDLAFSNPLHRIDDAEYFLKEARWRVRGGYEKRSRVIGSIAEMIAEEDMDFEATAVVDRCIDALKAEQLNWPNLTDYDRLSTAMDALESKGIVARENWWCCSNCGVDQIGYEIEDVARRGKRPRGYAFFHDQDVQAAVDGGLLYLDYGNADPHYSARKSEVIGQDVVRSFKAAGLDVEWNGNLSRRIAVRLNWQRRWPY